MLPILHLEGEVNRPYCQQLKCQPLLTEVAGRFILTGKWVYMYVSQYRYYYYKMYFNDV